MINKFSVSIIIALLIGLLVILLRSQSKLNNELLGLEVNGKISKIEFREKKMPFFYINNSWIYFGKHSYTIDRYLDEGDSIAKGQNSNRIELFKKKSESTQPIKYKKVAEIPI